MISVEGRQHPVELRYASKPVSDYLDAAIQTAAHIHRAEPSGDVLVFLTGAEEVDTAAELLSQQLHGDSRPVLVVPLYASMKIEEQMAAFEPAERGTRKIVLATNIAETSVTIDGVVYVVDCGFVKQRLYNPSSDSETLSVLPISQAQAIQRAGRAGRVCPGTAYRLYTEDQFGRLAVSTVPEIQRVRLDWPLLQLKALGVRDILHFHFISPPLPQVLMRSLEVLFALGALDKQGQLTESVGSVLAEMPVEPCISRMLLAGVELGCAEQVLTIAAMLSVSNPYTARTGPTAAPHKWAVKQGDHLSLLNLYNQYHDRRRDQNWLRDNKVNVRALKQAAQIRQQLAAYVKRTGRLSKPEEPPADLVQSVCKAVATGFFCNAARLSAEGEYVSVRSGMTMSLHPQSVVFKYPPAWIVFHEVVHTTKPFCRDVCSIDPLWLCEIAPHFYEYRKPKRAREE